MSELTICNCCNLARMRREAIRKKKRVTVVPSTFTMGGFEVYMHPRSVQIKQCTEEEKKRFWVAWMMEITEKCAC